MEALIEVTKDGNSHSHGGTGNTAQYGKCCKNMRRYGKCFAFGKAPGL